MTEREYPRWVHSDGRVSVVAETPDAEAAILERWAEADALEADRVHDDESNALTAPRRRGRPPKHVG